jgi:hypothetical protein
MDLSDVIERAELHTERTQRLGTKPDNGRRMVCGLYERLDCLKAAPALERVARCGTVTIARR